MKQQQPPPPLAPLKITDVLAAFAWIRSQLVAEGVTDDEQTAGLLEATINDVETDVISFLTNRVRITRSA